MFVRKDASRLDKYIKSRLQTEMPGTSDFCLPSSVQLEEKQRVTDKKADNHMSFLSVFKNEVIKNTRYA
jgi:hypothetical protein